MEVSTPDFSNLGALPRPKDDRDFPLGAAQVPVPRTPVFLPDNSRLRRNYQGHTTFCGQHSGTHLKAVLDYVALSTQNRFSPRYGVIKLKDPNSPVYDGYAINAGTDMRSIFKWLQKLGAGDFEPLENDVTLPIAQYCDPTVITPAMDAAAVQKKISNYAFSGTDFESVCQAIYQNKAVLLLIKCDEGFWFTSTPTFTTPKYGHFVVADGYDENAGYIRVIDSADPDDNHAIKQIAKQYFTPQFIIEAGTAVDLIPSVQHALSTQQLSLAEKIINDIVQALKLIAKELGHS